MIQNKNKIGKLVIPMIMVSLTLASQTTPRPQPKFWIGASGAANFNFYSGTTQTINSSVKAPAAFHDGFGVAPFASLLLEYRPHPILGVMLNVGYDDRSGTFNTVKAPCDCDEDLKTKLTYATFQPSLRITPFSNGLYFFAGAAYSYNLNKSFTYKHELQTEKKGDVSDVNQNIISSHIGVGFDIPLTAANKLTQINLSPFMSYHPYFGQEPRKVESWSLSTLRVGVSIKFGKVRVASADPSFASPPAVDAGVQFSVRAPQIVYANRKTKEIFPLRDYVFFDEGSSEIPNRYIKLQKDEPVNFKVSKFQESEAKNKTGISSQQLKVYHNILNILGDRMRNYPTSKITLIGASAGTGAEAGKAYAESIKKYLVTVFGINEARITTEGRNQPIVPSEQPGGKIDIALLKEGDRRVDIVSNTPELLAPVKVVIVQEDPNDSRIIFKSKSSPKETLKSWTIDVTDEKGNAQHFGPYKREQESISANALLGEKPNGTYKIVMLGETTDGKQIRKESSIYLAHNEELKGQPVRFSVLFDFNKSKTVASYEKYLTQEIAPLIADNGVVIIHGHTDIIGDEKHNEELSLQRATETERILKKALTKAGKNNIKYDVIGLGADTDFAPFENKLPEERFYNRTVVIDYVPNK